MRPPAIHAEADRYGGPDGKATIAADSRRCVRDAGGLPSVPAAGIALMFMRTWLQPLPGSSLAELLVSGVLVALDRLGGHVLAVHLDIRLVGLSFGAGVGMPSLLVSMP